MIIRITYENWKICNMLLEITRFSTFCALIKPVWVIRPKKSTANAKEQQWLIFVDMFRIRRCFVTAKKYKLHATTKDHSGQKLNSNSLDMFEIFFLQNNMLIFLSLCRNHGTILILDSPSKFSDVFQGT